MLHTFSLLALLLWNGRGMPHSQFAVGPQQSNRKRGETFSCGWSPGGSGSFSQADAEGAPHILLGNLGHVWAQNP